MKYSKILILLTLLNCGQKSTPESHLNVGGAVTFKDENVLTDGVVKIKIYTSRYVGVSAADWTTVTDEALCTGARISKDLILTAAHCLMTYEKGSSSISVAELGTVEKFWVEKSFQHNQKKSEENMKLVLDKRNDLGEARRILAESLAEKNNDVIDGYKFYVEELEKVYQAKVKDYYISTLVAAGSDLAILQLSKEASEKGVMDKYFEISNQEPKVEQPVYFAGYGLSRLGDLNPVIFSLGSNSGKLNMGFNKILNANPFTLMIRGEEKLGESEKQDMSVTKSSAQSFALPGDSGGPVISCNKPKKGKTYNESCNTKKVVAVWSRVVDLKNGVVCMASNVQGPYAKAFFKEVYNELGRTVPE